MADKFLTPKEQRERGVHYDAYYGRYLKDDGSDTPAPNFKANHYRHPDGMLNEFTRGAPITPEGRARLSAEKLAYDSVFDSGSAPNNTRKSKQSFMERLIFGRDS